MASSKKTKKAENTIVVSDPIAEGETMVNVDGEVLKANIKVATCGHVNKQFYGPNGKLQDLACTLAPGHFGDHSAPYMKNVGEPEHDEKGRVVKTTYHQEEAVAFWGDAAGKPAHEIQQGQIAQMTGFQKDLVMQILKKDPLLPVDQAIAQAKQLPQWNSVEPS